MDNIIFRCANHTDINALCEFEKEARLTEPNILQWPFDEVEYKENLLDINFSDLNHCKIVIAKKDDKILARCDIAIVLSLVDFKKTGYVDWIYTLINHRNNGIGKKLLETAEEFFKNNGVEYYYLFTASNEEAYEFYHRQDDLNFYHKEIAWKGFGLS